jgi:predicted 2-oxoglutarate/Fe(II)-dependent dioxygenase YbiX
MRIRIKATQKRQTRKRRTAYRWAAMGTLVAYSACMESVQLTGVYHNLMRRWAEV